MKRKLWKLVIPALLVIALIGYTAISAQGEFVQASYEIELQKPGAELEDARYLRDGNLLLVGGSESECFGVLTDTASQSAQPCGKFPEDSAAVRAAGPGGFSL